MDSFLEIDMTIEQAAAMRVILKVSHIYTMGEFMRKNAGNDFLKQLQDHVSYMDKWANLDRPFAIALHNKILIDNHQEDLSLKTLVKVYMTKADHEALASLLTVDDFVKNLKSTKSKAPAWFKGFISVVVVERNMDALRIIFARETGQEGKEQPPVFWFQQQAGKEIN